MGAVVIRPAEPRDRDVLIEQFLGLNLYEEAIAGNRRTDRPGAEASLDAALDRVAANGGVALVAERDGAVVGHLFLVFERDAVYVREELRAHAHVSELYVGSLARGAGIGTALLREAERRTLERGLRRLTIGVLAGNVVAERLYVRLGFRPHAIELEKPLTS